MNTNFFNQIQQLDFTGVLQLNISKGIAQRFGIGTVIHIETVKTPVICDN